MLYPCLKQLIIIYSYPSYQYMAEMLLVFIS